MKKLIRGSFFLTLVFVISITLTGCSNVDMGQVASGLGNVFGKVTSGLGQTLSGIFGSAGKIVENIKTVATPIAETFSNLAGKGDGIVSKIASGFEKVTGFLKKGGEAAEKVSELGENVGDALNKDSAGAEVSEDAKTTGVSANTEEDVDEVPTRTGSQSAEATKEDTDNSNLSTEEELKQRAQDISNGIQTSVEGVKELSSLAQDTAQKTGVVFGNTVSKVKDLFSSFGKVIKSATKNPTSSETKDGFNEAKDKTTEFVKETQGTIEEGKTVFNTIKDVATNVGSGIKNIVSIFSKK